MQEVNIMKNYTEQELEAISLTIESNKKVIDNSILWASKNLKYEEQSNLLLSLKSSKKVLTKINENLKNKPVIALFGASQVGKSYLIKNLLSVEGKPFLIENNFQKYDFLKDINPPGVGAESTGVVTRFTKEKKGVFHDFPIEVHLLNPKDILLIICDAFFLDSKKIIDFPRLADFEDHIQKFENNNSNNKQSVLSEFDLLDCKEYFELHFSKYTLLFDGLIKSRFFERIGRVIESIQYDEWIQIFSILWNKNQILSDLFSDLIANLKILGFDKKVFLNFDSVLRGKYEILDVKRLKELDTCNVSIQVKRINQEITSINLSYISALISELVFQIPEEILEEKEFMNNSDLLDFPGARSRLAIEISDITNEMKPDLMLRGKVSYLFNKYSDDFNINNLLFCTNDKQLDVNELPTLLFNWIEKNVGSNENERSKTLEQNEIDPLFVIFTFFNNQLKYDSTNDFDHIDSSKLNYKWDNRFNRFFQNEIVTQSKNWHKKWTVNSPLFKNFYLLRDFKYSDDTFFGFEENEKETGIVTERESYYLSLKKSFEEFEFVQNHFKSPALSWNNSSTINNDGTRYIIENLNKVSSNYSKICNYLNKIQIELDKVKANLRKHAHIDDLSELRIQAIRKSTDFQFSFNSSYSKDRTNFIRLLNLFYLVPVEIYNLINENIVSKKTSNSDSISFELKLLMSQFPEIKNGVTQKEILSILQKNLFLENFDEVEKFLKDKGVSLDQISKSESQNSLSANLIELICTKWEEAWRVKFISNNLGLKENQVEFLFSHYKTIFELKGYKSKLSTIFSSVLNEIEQNRGREEFLAETTCLVINDLVNNFDINDLSQETLLEIENIASTYNIDCQFLKKSEVVLSDERLSEFFDSNLIESNDLPIQKYSLWVNKFKISVLASCGFVEYDEVANNELMNLISKINTL